MAWSLPWVDDVQHWSNAICCQVSTHVLTQVGKMLPWCTENTPNSMNIWDVDTKLVHCVQSTKHRHIRLILLYWYQFQQRSAHLNMLFILEMTCTAHSAGQPSMNNMSK